MRDKDRAMSIATLTTPFGPVTLQTDHHTLTALSFSAPPLPITSPSLLDPLLKHIQHELIQWFTHPAFSFTIPLTLTGTPFQKTVWDALRQIPCGQTLTYSELATMLQSSPRAIGNACRANPIALIVPCHRVVAKQGLGGYMGATSGERLHIKTQLLAHESLAAH